MAVVRTGGDVVSFPPEVLEAARPLEATWQFIGNAGDAGITGDTIKDWFKQLFPDDQTALEGDSVHRVLEDLRDWRVVVAYRVEGGNTIWHYRTNLPFSEENEQLILYRRKLWLRQLVIRVVGEEDRTGEAISRRVLEVIQVEELPFDLKWAKGMIGATTKWLKNRGWIASVTPGSVLQTWSLGDRAGGRTQPPPIEQDPPTPREEPSMADRVYAYLVGYLKTKARHHGATVEECAEQLATILGAKLRIPEVRALIEELVARDAEICLYPPTREEYFTSFQLVMHRDNLPMARDSVDATIQRAIEKMADVLDTRRTMTAREIEQYIFSDEGKMLRPLILFGAEVKRRLPLFMKGYSSLIRYELVKQGYAWVDEREDPRENLYVSELRGHRSPDELTASGELVGQEDTADGELVEEQIASGVDKVVHQQATELDAPTTGQRVITQVSLTNAHHLHVAINGLEETIVVPVGSGQTVTIIITTND